MTTRPRSQCAMDAELSGLWKRRMTNVLIFQVRFLGRIEVLKSSSAGKG